MPDAHPLGGRTPPVPLRGTMARSVCLAGARARTLAALVCAASEATPAARAPSLLHPKKFAFLRAER
jgi:hypothetical protein